MQIQCDQIVLKDIRLHIGKHALNVVRIDGGGKVIVDGRVAVSLHSEEHAQYELLDVADVFWVALELRIVVRDVALGGQDFRLEQVGFVQEQNYGDAGKCGIVDDRVEDILRLLQTIGASKMVVMETNNTISFVYRNVHGENQQSPTYRSSANT